jgi:nucleotide-binding universal stress UspA family protein
MARILLATDGSPSAEAATREAVELARATGWSLTIVTVWHIPVTGFAYEPLVSVPEVAEAVQQRAQLALETAVATAQASGLEPEARLIEGLPAADICDLARDRGATLIVIGSHGWGTVQRLLFGSVSAAVLHHAPCPVLIVRGVLPDDATA